MKVKDAKIIKPPAKKARFLFKNLRSEKSSRAKASASPTPSDYLDPVRKILTMIRISKKGLLKALNSSFSKS